MHENIGLILGGLAVLALAVAGYVAWRESRREEDAQQPDQQAQRPIWRPGSQRDDS